MKRTVALVLLAAMIGGWWSTTQPRYCDHWNGLAIARIPIGDTGSAWERACVEWSPPVGTSVWRLR